MIEASPGYETNRARISLALSEFTVPLFSRIYQALDGDKVAAIVLHAVAHRNVEAWLAEQNNPEGVRQDPARHTAVMRPCNALSTAVSCALPRETVRRKVALLIRRGYIDRAANGHLYLTPTVGDGFQEMTARLVEGLLATAKRLDALLADRPTSLGPLRLD